MRSETILQSAKKQTQIQMAIDRANHATKEVDAAREDLKQAIKNWPGLSGRKKAILFGWNDTNFCHKTAPKAKTNISDLIKAAEMLAELEGSNRQ